MDFKRIAIIGTDIISISIALGLKAQKEPPEIIGYDANTVAADLARARKAFDQVKRKPGRACRDTDLVIVAVPVAEIRETFAAIASDLRPGCLVTDTARLKAPVLRWAKELLPENISFVGGHPIPNPAVVGLDPVEELDAARADLLKEALYCFTPLTGGPSEAIDACSQLAQTLQARPFFLDVTEHDGLEAGVGELPDLLTIALLRATVDTPGWREMRKFASRRFATATEAADEAYERHTSVFLNRENLIHRLDVLVGELMRLRDLLTHDDVEALEETFAAAAEGRARWIKEREQGMWIKERASDINLMPAPGEQLGRMFLGSLATRLREAPDRSRKE